MGSFYIGFGLVIAWNLVFWTIFPAKLAVDGFFETFGFFTNWTFAQNGVYFTLELAGYVMSFTHPGGGWRSYQKYLRYILLWSVIGANFLVFFLVFLLMMDNWEMMESMTQQGGGTYTLGVVVDFEKLFHTVPTLFCLYFYAGIREEVSESMQDVRDMMANAKTHGAAWFVITMQLFSGAILMFMFEALLGFNAVYSAHIPVSLGILFALVIVIAVVMPLYYIAFVDERFYSPAKPQKRVEK
jgi:hypothetical protein